MKLQQALIIVSATLLPPRLPNPAAWIWQSKPGKVGPNDDQGHFSITNWLTESQEFGMISGSEVVKGV